MVCSGAGESWRGGAPQKLSHGLGTCEEVRRRRHLVPAVRATVGLLEPLLDAVVAEDMFTLGQPQGCLVDAFGIAYPKLIVADDAH